jgi:hypothetical protein
MQLKNRFIAKAGVTIVLAVISAKPVNVTIILNAVSLLTIIESNNMRLFIGRFNHPSIRIITALIDGMKSISKIHMIYSRDALYCETISRRKNNR